MSRTSQEEGLAPARPKTLISGGKPLFLTCSIVRCKTHLEKHMRIIALILLCTASAFAQQMGNPTAQQGVMPARGTFAIRNARIVTVSGADIENGTVVIRDGKIEAVGTNVSVPAGAQTIDGRGLSVYPGMIDAGTNMGLVEVPQGANGTVDTSEVGDFNPNSRAIIAVNPHSAHIA